MKDSGLIDALLGLGIFLGVCGGLIWAIFHSVKAIKKREFRNTLTRELHTGREVAVWATVRIVVYSIILVLFLGAALRVVIGLVE